MDKIVDATKVALKNKILAGVGIIGVTAGALSGAYSYSTGSSSANTIAELNQKVLALNDSNSALKGQIIEDSNQIIKLQNDLKTAQDKPVEIQTVTKEVKVIDPETQYKLNAAVQFAKDNIDEDVSVDYIVFETDAVNETENYINQNIADILDDNDYFDDGAVFADYRKSEISVKKLSDYTVEDRDFDKKDVTLVYDVRVRAKETKSDSDAEYKTFKITVPYEKGVMQESDITADLE